MPKGRLATPFQVKRLSREINAALGKVVAEYDEAHLYVHEQKDRHHPTEEERQQSSEIRRVRRTSDPTGDIVASQESNRRRLVQAVKKLEHAAREIDAAHAGIRRVFQDPEDEYTRLENVR